MFVSSVIERVNPYKYRREPELTVVIRGRRAALIGNVIALHAAAVLRNMIAKNGGYVTLDSIATE